MTLIKSVQEIVAETDNPLLSKHDSWKRINLKQIANILNGFAFKSKYFDKNKGFPIIRIRDVGNDYTDAFYTQNNFDPMYVIKKGELIVGMDGDFKSAFWNGPDALLNQRVCKIALNSNYYSLKFLALVLPGYLDEIHKYTSSVTVKHLSSNDIYEIPLPLPPYNEQVRIVSHVEELFSQLDAGVRSLQAAQTQLEQYRQAILRQAYTGKLTKKWRVENQIQSESWRTLKLYELAKTTSGGTPSRSKKEYYGGSIPWLKSGELNDGIIYSTEEYITKEALVNSSAKLFPKGTLLIALYGATVGKLGILDMESSTNQAIAAIFTNKELDKKFLFWYLFYIRNDLLNKRMGGAQPNISQTILKEIYVPITSMDEQKMIVEKIENTTSIIDKIKQELKKNKIKGNILKTSILRKAFEGHLIPQDPKDEPASVLLERIKAQKTRQTRLM